MMFAGSDTRLIGIIESVRGLNAVESIAAATPKLAGLIFGAADMAADIGAASTWEPLALARARLVSACAMNGIPAIDAPFLMSTMFQAYSLRPFAHLISAFLQKRPFIPHKSAQSIPYLPPTAAEIRHARAVLAENTKGVGTVNGMMIDEAVARQARRVLTRAGISA